mmetsp:Transcript_11010/g.12162  ORF Transcript_11010/g.12162 Transcript_11010/m.12162 type:complete len:120 (-) Transcript_11010:197-556(-)
MVESSLVSFDLSSFSKLESESLSRSLYSFTDVSKFDAVGFFLCLLVHSGDNMIIHWDGLRVESNNFTRRTSLHGVDVVHKVSTPFIIGTKIQRGKGPHLDHTYGELMTFGSPQLCLRCC